MSEKIGYVAICDECEKEMKVWEYRSDYPKRESIIIKLCQSCLSSCMPNVIKKLERCPEIYYADNGRGQQPKIYLSDPFPHIDINKMTLPPINRYVEKNPENPLEELLEMADLIGCPEELIISEYNTFIKELPSKDAYTACRILLDIWNKHYIPLMNKLRAKGVLKKVGYQDL